jgi:hypothetical protein
MVQIWGWFSADVEFESNEPTQARVLSFVHHSHTAAAQLGEDAVVRDRRVDYIRLHQK